MKVLELKNLYSEDIGLYYRRNYTALAVLELPIRTTEVPIDFIIEISPLGTKDIFIDLKTNVDYPLIPLKREIKNYILNREREGLLV